MRDEDLMKELQEAKVFFEKQENPETKNENKTEEVQNQEENSNSVVNSESGIVSDQKTNQFSEVEKEAMSQGWRPDYQGTNKKSAEEFVRDGSFFRKIADLKKDNEELREAFKTLTSHQKKLEKAAYEKALSDFQTQRNVAIENGEVSKVHELDEHIYNTRDVIKSITPEVQTSQKVGPTQEALNFKETNKEWFDVDLLKRDPTSLQGRDLQKFKMTKAAFIYDEHLGRTRPGNPADNLKEVESFIKDTYSEFFKNPARQEAPVTMKSTAASTTQSNLVSRMTEHQKSVYQMYVSVDKNFGSLEDYAKQLDSIGELKK